MPLRTLLGPGTFNHHPDHPNELTMHEMGEFIRRAGRLAGFDVQSEFAIGQGRRCAWRIDWVWKDPKSGRPVVAFEVEGRDVPRSSLRGDLTKFERLDRDYPGCVKVIALYTRRRQWRLNDANAPAWVAQNWTPDDPDNKIRVLRDCELFAPDSPTRIEVLDQLDARLQWPIEPDAWPARGGLA